MGHKSDVGGWTPPPVATTPLTALSLSAPQAAGWTPLLAAAAAVVTLGSAMPVGYNIGVINTPAAVRTIVWLSPTHRERRA